MARSGISGAGLLLFTARKTSGLQFSVSGLSIWVVEALVNSLHFSPLNCQWRKSGTIKNRSAMSSRGEFSSRIESSW